METSIKADRVCIIGAGLSGLAAAKYALAERAFSRVTIYESRKNVGGLWNYTPLENGLPYDRPVARANPQCARTKLAIDDTEQSNKISRDTVWISPVYDRLEANNPRNVMRYSDQEWPTGTQLFPKHAETLRYLERYAQEVKSLVKLGTQVVDVQQTTEGKWTVRTQEVSRGEEAPVHEEMFDAIIVASGHFDVPFVPVVTGIEAWRRAYPRSITHSKYFRKPEDFAQKKTIVVGNSASGIDIGLQISGFCKGPLLLSSRSESFLVNSPSECKVEKPEIVEIIAQDRSVKFADGSIETGVDAILYCTGYLYSFPFLKSLDPPVVSTGERVLGTYQHIFYQANPTLAFLVLNQKVLPFPTAETQAAVVARVLSGRLSLPPRGKMAQWESERLSVIGREKDFHVLNYPNDCEYINMLHDWAVSGSTKNGDTGKIPPVMDEKQFWTRERFAKIKKAFQDLGKERLKIQTIEDLGFDFEAWNKGQSREQKSGGNELEQK